MWLALPARLEQAAAIAGVRVVVIRGTAGNFISGADIKEFERLRSDPGLAREYDRGAESTLEVSINHIQWHEADNLTMLGPREHAFITQTDSQGVTTTVFGDGQYCHDFA